MQLAAEFTRSPAFRGARAWKQHRIREIEKNTDALATGQAYTVIYSSVRALKAWIALSCVSRGKSAP